MHKINIYTLFTCFLSIGVLLHTSCSEESYETSDYYDPLYIALGSIKHDAHHTSFLLDNGDHLYAYTSEVNLTNSKDGERVLLHYSILETASNSEYDYNIKVNNILPVLTKEVITNYDSTLLDTIGNDPITLNSARIGGGYLNLDITHFWSEQEHPFNLILIDSTTSPLVFELRHHAKGSSDGAITAKFASFNLKPFQEPSSNKLALILRYRHINGRIEEVALTYNY